MFSKEENASCGKGHGPKGHGSRSPFVPPTHEALTKAKMENILLVEAKQKCIAS